MFTGAPWSVFSSLLYVLVIKERQTNQPGMCLEASTFNSVVIFFYVACLLPQTTLVTITIHPRLAKRVCTVRGNVTFEVFPLYTQHCKSIRMSLQSQRLNTHQFATYRPNTALR